MVYDTWDWNSYQPLLSTLVEIFHFDFILELGIGKFSTPFFLKQDADLMCIENDLEWLNNISKLNENKKNVRLLHHKLNNRIQLGTKVHELSQVETVDAILYYKNLSKDIGGTRPKQELRLMFVDQFTCLRTYSINFLYDKFDIIIYHDCEPNGIPWYSYYFDKGLTDNYIQLKLVTPVSWTGCFIHKSIQFNFETMKQRCYDHCVQFIKNSHDGGLFIDAFYLRKETCSVAQNTNETTEKK